MSDFDPRYHRSPKASPEIKVADFQPETFARVESVDPLPDPEEDFQKEAPPLPPPPDPFEEFTAPDHNKPLSSLMADLPSLDGLFRPFDLEPENQPSPKPYEDLTRYDAPGEYSFEDLDTRDPDIIRTLAQAEAEGRALADKARKEAEQVLDGARAETRQMAAEAEAKSRMTLEEARQRAADLTAAADRAREAAEDNQRLAAEARAEAENQLTAAQDRIAGLEQERQTLAEEAAAHRAEVEAYRLELDQAHVRRQAELEAAQAEALKQARAEGRNAGLAQGTEEGRAAGRAEALKNFHGRVEGFIAMLGKMESLYQDLWRANGPMMIKLAIEAAEQIVNKELRQAGDLTTRAFEACVDFLSQANRVTFIVRPQDIAQLEQARADQRARLGALVKITFQPDETLGPGDLIVESDIGRLDATVKHRTAQVMEALRGAFAGAYGDLTDNGLSAGPAPASAPKGVRLDDLLPPAAEPERPPEAAAPPAELMTVPDEKPAAGVKNRTPQVMEVLREAVAGAYGEAPGDSLSADPENSERS